MTDHYTVLLVLRHYLPDGRFTGETTAAIPLDADSLGDAREGALKRAGKLYPECGFVVRSVVKLRKRAEE